jgi:hypothetical protein
LLIGHLESLSEIDFGRRKINNLQKCPGSQVVDSSFGNFLLRQALEFLHYFVENPGFSDPFAPLPSPEGDRCQPTA